MSIPILVTKLYIPAPKPNIVPRPRLIERLHKGLQSKLALISAPAGFGKTTLLAEWVAGCGLPAAWLSLDEGDSDPARFLTYLIAAMRTPALRGALGGAEDFGEGLLVALQSPKPPPIEWILTALLNEIAAFPGDFVLVLDDYHLVDAQPAERVLSFAVGHLPPHLHLVIATREDPHLPLAQLRARGELAELRAADLRFSPSEAAEFLNHAMGLALSAEDVAALETRTEGWITGLQLAAISMQGGKDPAGFINSFTGSHRFVLDYLVDEVLQKQSESVQTFLLRTSILERLCGPLCEAVLPGPAGSGQGTLEYLDRANLFLVPLDDERRWYRYHHLFADLLRQRLPQSVALSKADAERGIAELHTHASQWYEDNGLMLEAFRHAAAAGDIEHALRLVEAKTMPLHVRGVATAVLDWLASLPAAVMDARPILWVRCATISLINGQTAGVEEKLQAAEAALEGDEAGEENRDLLGQIAAARATLALTRYDVETMLAQAQRALEYLHPDNLAFRFTAYWTLAFANLLLGDRAAAGRASVEGMAISRASGDPFSIIMAASGLGQIQAMENQLFEAAETYRNILPLFGDTPQPNACEVKLGLARIYYEWNDLDVAEQYAQESLEMARLYDKVIDRFVFSEVFLACVKLARGDAAGAAAQLAETDQSVREHNFVQRMPEVAAARILVLLRQGNLAAAAQLAGIYELPLSRARVFLAQGDPDAALAVLSPLGREMEEKGWADERLKVMVLQAVALQAHGKKEMAVQALGDALALAEPGGFVRLFVDEGAPMATLLSAAAARRILPAYTSKLLAALEVEERKREGSSVPPRIQPLIEPLSEREVEVLRLIAQGLTNREIGDRLSLALDTVKGHNRRIFDKLQVQRRMEAITRARELGLI